jgi:hypothetical protein
MRLDFSEPSAQGEVALDPWSQKWSQKPQAMQGRAGSDKDVKAVI